MRGLLLLFVGAVLGCSSFGSADDTAVDSGIDAGGQGQGNACVGPCETFESAQWKSDWGMSGPGAIDVTVGESTSPSHAVDLTVTGDVRVQLARGFGMGNKLVASVSMKVVSAGEGELDLFAIRMSADLGSDGIKLVHQAKEQRYAIQANGVVTPVTASFGAFIRVTLEVDIAMKTWTFKVGGDQMSGPLDAMWTKGSPFYVAFGALFASDIKGAWHIRFDDVEVKATP